MHSNLRVTNSSPACRIVLLHSHSCLHHAPPSYLSTRYWTHTVAVPAAFVQSLSVLVRHIRQAVRRPVGLVLPPTPPHRNSAGDPDSDRNVHGEKCTGSRTAAGAQRITALGRGTVGNGAPPHPAASSSRSNELSGRSCAGYGGRGCEASGGSAWCFLHFLRPGRERGGKMRFSHDLYRLYALNEETNKQTKKPRQKPDRKQVACIPNVA